MEWRSHCAHVLNKSFKGFTGGKVRKENFPKSEKSGGAGLNKGLHGFASSKCMCPNHMYKYNISLILVDSKFFVCLFHLYPNFRV